MSFADDPYADDPVLSALPREVRQQVADQVAQGKRLAATNTLRKAIGGGLANAAEFGRACEALGSYGQADKNSQPDKPAQPLKLALASGKVDKAGTTVTLYRDGTFITTGMFRTSDPDRLIAFTSDIDSMRRKSATGRGAAAVFTSGISLAASNNRGVVYVTVSGAISGTKTYTTRNPDNKLLSDIRSLQTAASSILASPPAVPAEASASLSQQSSDVATQLKMLADLHVSGALSDDEFAAAKARLLS